MRGLKLCLVLGLLILNSCRSDTPPAIENCILAPAGGADCVEVDGSHVFKTPSQMVDYWATNGSDFAKFVGWAYGAKTPAQMAVVRAGLQQIKENIQKEPAIVSDDQ
jgi:hypothetical protein